MKTYKGDAYQAAYERHEQAEKQGHCDECGWKDGDGAATCFYSDQIGSVTHTNSENAVIAQMSESQRMLYRSTRNKISAVTREEYERMLSHLLGKVTEKTEEFTWPLPHVDRSWMIGITQYKSEPSWTTDKNKNPVLSTDMRYVFPSREDAVRAHLKDFKIVDEAIEQGWHVIGIDRWHTDLLKTGLYAGLGITVQHLEKPVPHGFNACLGFQVFNGPYSTKCDVCGLEVNLWEFGVDYDVG
jgi:hypothetical protein